jgi:hypothetical protein
MQVDIIKEESTPNNPVVFQDNSGNIVFLGNADGDNYQFFVIEGFYADCLINRWSDRTFKQKDIGKMAKLHNLRPYHGEITIKIKP